jgi:hypothetical protein
MYQNNRPNFSLGWLLTILCINNFFPTTRDIYAFQTYPDLSYLPESWEKYKKFKFVPLVGLNNTPPMC